MEAYYKPATLLLKTSILKDICDFFSELYWFKLKKIIEKGETYSETFIGDVFRKKKKHLRWSFLQK